LVLGLLGDGQCRHASRPALGARHGDDQVKLEPTLCKCGPDFDASHRHRSARWLRCVELPGTWVWAELTLTFSLDFWDFTASVTPFFGHWAGVIALPAIITHYLMAWWWDRERPVPSSKQLRRVSGGESQRTWREREDASIGLAPVCELFAVA
jgi:hypothetical protein